MAYELEDVSVIIATYNRASDLKITLDSLPSLSLLKEVIIVDQSKNPDTKNLVKKYKKVKYIYSKIPSLTRARNLGISELSKKSKIAIFLDDDVTLAKEYFKRILEIYNNYPGAKAVGGYFWPAGIGKISSVETILRRFFLIEHYELNRSRVLSAYGATYPYKLTKNIFSQWIPGFNMSFKKEIIKEFKFDENMSGYALAEDFDFTYRVFKKYPGSLILTPAAKLTHRVSLIERHPTKKISYFNQINHIYLSFKNFDKLLETLRLFWCLFGIITLRIINLALKRRNIDKLKLIFFLKSLAFCFIYLGSLKRGKLDHLYMKAGLK